MIQKIHSQKPVLKTKLFTVNELAVEVKPSLVRTHHNIERNPTVHVLPITESGEIVLISQYRYNLQKDVLECVSGFIEEGESPLQAAKRELQEETGLTASTWKGLPKVELGAGSFIANIHMFIAKGLTEGKTSFDESEEIKRIHMSLSEAIVKVMSGEINVVSSMTLLLLANQLQKEGKL